MTRRSNTNNEVEAHIWSKAPYGDPLYSNPIAHQIVLIYPDSKAYNIAARFWDLNPTYVDGPCDPDFIAREWKLWVENLGDSNSTFPCHSIFFKNLGSTYAGLSGIYWDYNWGTTSDQWGTQDGSSVFNIYKELGLTSINNELQGLYQNAWDSIKTDSYATFNITHGSASNSNYYLSAINAATGGTNSHIMLEMSDLNLTHGSFTPGDSVTITNEVLDMTCKVHSYVLKRTQGSAKLVLRPPFLVFGGGSPVDPLENGYLTRVFSSNGDEYFISTDDTISQKPITKIYQFSGNSLTANIIGTLRGYTGNSGGITGTISIGFPFFSDREPLPPRWSTSGLSTLEREIRNGADDFVGVTGTISPYSTPTSVTSSFDASTFTGSIYTGIKVFYPYGYGLSGATSTGVIHQNSGILNKSCETTPWQKVGRETIKYWSKAVFSAISATCSSNNIPGPAIYVDDNEYHIGDGQRWLYRPSSFNFVQSGALGFLKNDIRWGTDKVTRNKSVQDLITNDSDFYYLSSQSITSYYPYPVNSTLAVDANYKNTGGTGQIQANTLLYEVAENSKYEAIYFPAFTYFPLIRTVSWKSAPIGNNYVFEGQYFYASGASDSKHKQKVFLGTHPNIVFYPRLASYTGNVDSEFLADSYAAEGLTAQIRYTNLKKFKYDVDGISAGCAEQSITKNGAIWIAHPGWSPGYDGYYNNYFGVKKQVYPLLEDDIINGFKYAYDNIGCKTMLMWCDKDSNTVNMSITGTTAGTSISGKIYHFNSSSATACDFYANSSSLNGITLTGTGVIAATANDLLSIYGNQEKIINMTGYISTSSTGSVKFLVSSPFDASPVVDFRRLDNMLTRVDNLFNIPFNTTVSVYGSTYGMGPLDIFFSASVTGGTPVSYEWKLLGSDGPISSTGTTASYTYTEPGTYNAIFTVRSYGRSDTIVTNIEVLSRRGGDGGGGDGGTVISRGGKVVHLYSNATTLKKGPNGT